jgi:hypothetical protein
MDKKRMNKRVIFIVIGVIIVALLASGVWWLFNSGRLVYLNSQSTVACGTDVVNKYNAAMYYQVRNGSTVPNIDTKGVKDLVTNIETKANFKNDPTCQTIIFWSAVQDDNYKSALSAYNVLISLHNKRIFVDSNLRNDQPLFMYEDTLSGLTGSGSSSGTFGG